MITDTDGRDLRAERHCRCSWRGLKRQHLILNINGAYRSTLLVKVRHQMSHFVLTESLEATETHRNAHYRITVQDAATASRDLHYTAALDGQVYLSWRNRITERRWVRSCVLKHSSPPPGILKCWQLRLRRNWNDPRLAKLLIKSVAQRNELLRRLSVIADYIINVHL